MKGWPHLTTEDLTPPRDADLSRGCSPFRGHGDGGLPCRPTEIEPPDQQQSRPQTHPLTHLVPLPYFCRAESLNRDFDVVGSMPSCQSSVVGSASVAVCNDVRLTWRTAVVQPVRRLSLLTRTCQMRPSRSMVHSRKSRFLSKAAGTLFITGSKFLPAIPPLLSTVPESCI